MARAINEEALNDHLAEERKDAVRLLRHIREHCYSGNLDALEYIAEHIDDFVAHLKP